MLILLGCTMLIVKNNDNEKGEMLSIPVNNNELLVCSEEGYNSIKVYRQENQIVVYAESESAFFEGTQFSVGISGEITPENVEIIWMTIGGGTYAKEIGNTIAFGCAFPGKDYRIHNVNEWVEIDELLLQAEIYVQAIINLLNV